MVILTITAPTVTFAASVRALPLHPFMPNCPRVELGGDISLERAHYAEGSGGPSGFAS